MTPAKRKMLVLNFGEDPFDGLIIFHQINTAFFFTETSQSLGDQAPASNHVCKYMYMYAVS